MSKKIKRFSDDYFETYNNGVPYGIKGHDRTFDSVEDMMKVIDMIGFSKGRRTNKQRYIDNVLDVGAANGYLMKRFKEVMGVDVKGVEYNDGWCKDNIEKSIKNDILFGNWFEVCDQFKTNSFDLVIDCISMYLSPKKSALCLQECVRVAKKFVLIIAPIITAVVTDGDDNPIYDPYDTIPWKGKKWCNHFSKACGAKVLVDYADGYVVGVL